MCDQEIQFFLRELVSFGSPLYTQHEGYPFWAYIDIERKLGPSADFWPHLQGDVA